MSYVVAGYGVTLLTLAGYVWRVVHRSRTLSRSLPPEQWR